MDEAKTAQEQPEDARPGPSHWEKEAEKAWDKFETTRETIFRALYPDDDSNLFRHAKRELELAGMFDSDADYGGALGGAVMDLMRVFCAQGHSGFSAPRVIQLFALVANYRTLTKNDHSLFHDVGGDEYPPDTYLQDSRDSQWFSRDGGKTWKNVHTDAIEAGSMAS